MTKVGTQMGVATARSAVFSATSSAMTRMKNVVAKSPNYAEETTRFGSLPFGWRGLWMILF